MSSLESACHLVHQDRALHSGEHPGIHSRTGLNNQVHTAKLLVYVVDASVSNGLPAGPVIGAGLGPMFDLIPMRPGRQFESELLAQTSAVKCKLHDAKFLPVAWYHCG